MFVTVYEDESQRRTHRQVPVVAGTRPEMACPTVTGPLVSANQRLRQFMGAVLVADLGVIAFAIWLACQIRGHWGVWGEGVGESDLPHLCLSYGPWIGLGWLGWLAVRGGYSRKVFSAGGDEFSRAFTASLLAAGTVAMVCYLTKFDLSRGFVSLSFLIGTPLLLSERFVARKLLHATRRNGRMQHRVVVLGDPAQIVDITEILRRERYVGYTVVGACTSVLGPSAMLGEPISPIPVVGGPDDIREVALRMQVDAVLVVGGQSIGASDVRRTAWALEGTDVDLIVVPSLTDIAGPRVHVRPVAGLPLLHIEPPQADEAVRWGKRAFDIVCAAGLLFAGLPIWFIVALAIKLDDGGPVLFRQRRVGLHGTVFDCLKFRSMRPDAERLRDSLLDLNESDGLLFKIRHDPRVTRTGRFIRRYSIDELPQIINVLRGEMSLVGPRPPLPSEVEGYEVSVGRRLLVRPGMTGLWQVSGRSTLSWRDSVRLDLYYVDNWSLFQDVVILLKTMRAVVRPQGAS